MMGNKLAELQDPPEAWVAGSVEFNSWHRVPWLNSAVMGVHGKVRIVSSEQAVGFVTQGDGQANWVALVRGPEDGLIVIPGCKVASVVFGTDITCEDFARVP